MKPLRTALAATLTAGLAVGLIGCSSAGGGASEKTIKVAYESTETFSALDDLFTRIAPEFEKQHPGVKVELQPIKANDDDYKTKIQLSQRSASTAPDVFYEDTYNIGADAAAGYLKNLDPYLAKWSDWSQFSAAAKQAGQAAGGTYGVPLGVDTRVLWYSKSVFAKAGIPTPWQPATWQDVLDTAATIKQKVPGVIQFNLYIGQGMGESTSITTMLPLLYGTGAKLYDADSKKWVIGSQGLIDSLAFVKTVYDKGYSTSKQDALDGNIWQTLLGQDFPKARLASTIEGSYLPSFWQKGGDYEWPGYTSDMAVSYWPTQNGDGSKYVSLSGGWTLAVGAKSKNPELAFQFLALAMSKSNAEAYDIQNSQIAVRQDVAESSKYQAGNPFVDATTKAVEFTQFRPSDSNYPAVSLALQKATESVAIKGESPEQAAKEFDQAVTKIVGAAHTVSE